MTDLRKIDINLLVVLNAILEEKNLTKAGEQVGLSQSAVSGALTRLREHFHDDLLDRKGKSFELSDRAIEIQPLVRKALSEIDQLYNILPNFDAASSDRTFTIAASDYVVSVISQPLLKVLGEIAPKVKIDFEVMPSVKGVSQVDLLRRDVIISSVGTGIAGKRKSLFSDRFVCVVDKNHPRLRQGTLSYNDLEELRMVKAGFGEAINTGVDIWLAESGIVPKVTETVSGFLPVPFAVARSTKYGLIPKKLAIRHLEHLGLVMAETPLPKNILIEAVHWHPSKTQDPAVSWLVEALRQASELIEDED
ncbi:MAG: hypothetical protein RL418_290 [Actinomycetota bacterium]